MVESNPAIDNNQARSALKRSSPNSLVWSHYDEIQKLAVQPVEALINLVGSKDTTHSVLTDIIQVGIRDIITKTEKITSNYAPPLARI